MDQNEAGRKDHFSDPAVLQGHRTAEPTKEGFPCKAPNSFGLYIHIPFCTYRCPYCDFYTHPLRPAGASERYVRAVERELKESERVGVSAGKELRTLFYGGGTPSLLPTAELEKLQKAVTDIFMVASGAEVTIEINPEDVTLDAAKSWLAVGINRASLGVQSLHDEELKRLKRIHSADQARNAFALLRRAGFENIGIDLMFGLEGQTRDAWRATLDEALSWAPDHVSTYCLTVEERTVFAREHRKGTLRLPRDEIQSDMYQEGSEQLQKKGLARYELSNFARVGFESKHNLNYWVGGAYWGVGVSAHSFWNEGGRYRRWWNGKDLFAYLKALEEGAVPTQAGETLTSEVHFGERVMTGLRLARGINLEATAAELGIQPAGRWRDEISSLISAGYILADRGLVRLTDRGYFVSDEIVGRLLRL